MIAGGHRAAHLDVPTWAWAVFAVVVIVNLAIDLLLHRGNHTGGRRQAVIWSLVWIGVSLLFAAFVGVEFGSHVAQEFLTAWLVEKSLSVDNLFVFLVIFGRTKIPRSEQHRVLFWGILGAFGTRALFIAAGSAILSRFEVATYVLGAFLVYTGIKTFRSHPNDEEEKESRILAWLKQRLPFTEDMSQRRFIVRETTPEGVVRRVATPLLLALVAIEVSDILFAVDSIPAVFAISSDPFIVFSSNVFAILGLRALYLVLADFVAELEYLHYGLGTLLVFIGAKMLASHYAHLPHWASLLVTVLILAGAIIPSVVRRRRRLRQET